MVNNNTQSGGAETPHSSDRLARRSFLVGTTGVVGGSLGVPLLTDSAGAQSGSVTVDVKSTINLESGGVIPVEVQAAKGGAPGLLPVGDNVDLGPRFGPSRLLDCPRQQWERACLKQVIEKDYGATPAHGGHRQGKRRAMLHFRIQEMDINPAIDVQNGLLTLRLLWVSEDPPKMLGGEPVTDVSTGTNPTPTTTTTPPES